ncbi:hypothetical protein F511_41621 [Dorcoceras hygrometricum]|uniref:Uncharacterized protein n=1 Tax=Dorcoceras hygrometricum TaxID=472368 RepID=A0A2Z6ZZS5_9LAMI|nr:hypothetical protein F511_41621 [Dorcoceras hygrometricum]
MANSEGFPAADVRRELNPGLDKDFQVDPISSEVAASKEIQEQFEAAKKAREQENKDAMQSFKTTIIVSGVVVVVAGAVFAIAKKLREK